MLTVTDAAAARLAEFLDAENCPQEIAIRFVVDGQALAMRPDRERPGDTTYAHQGRTVLLLDREMAELLANETLDMDGERLVLRGESESP